MASTIEIFYSYAHEDEKLRNKLEQQLALLQRHGQITNRHDRKISPGMEWANEIDSNLDNAQIILLLVSPAFLSSDYCYGVEMKRALERHKRGEARVIPIILRSVHWEEAPFGRLQALPTDGKPVTSRSWHNLDEAFFDVARGIRKAIKELMHSSYDVPFGASRGSRDYTYKRDDYKNEIDMKIEADILRARLEDLQALTHEMELHNYELELKLKQASQKYSLIPCRIVCRSGEQESIEPEHSKIGA